MTSLKLHDVGTHLAMGDDAIVSTGRSSEKIVPNATGPESRHSNFARHGDKGSSPTLIVALYQVEGKAVTAYPVGIMADKLKPVRIPRPSRRPKPTDVASQFLVVLAGTEPLVWRRIQVPEKYSFWDLHVAIQDVMGWQDYHLHEFRVVHPTRERMDRIGIPMAEFVDDVPNLPGWDVAISNYFGASEQPALYTYDFGDDWRHVVMYEGLSTMDPELTYPRCVGGAGSGPPEDCGGVHGFADFLLAIGNPRHPDHKAMHEWSAGRFHAGAFDPAAVVFDDPKKRWQVAFGGRS